MTPATANTPVGDPSFGLTDDQVETVLQLACWGSSFARHQLTSGMHERTITRLVRNGMRQARDEMDLAEIEIYSEVALASSDYKDPSDLGCVDLVLRFIHQFSNERAYVAMECKRVADGNATLNSRYVSQGVDRFATGKYAGGHLWGFMLGYVLVMPVEGIVQFIDSRIRRDYGEGAALRGQVSRQGSLAVCEGDLIQPGDSKITIKHIFVDMLPARPVRAVD